MLTLRICFLESQGNYFFKYIYFFFSAIQGDEADGMYFVEEGTVRVTKTNEVNFTFSLYINFCDSNSFDH